MKTCPKIVDLAQKYTKYYKNTIKTYKIWANRILKILFLAEFFQTPIFDHFPYSFLINR